MSFERYFFIQSLTLRKLSKNCVTLAKEVKEIKKRQKEIILILEKLIKK